MRGQISYVNMENIFIGHERQTQYLDAVFARGKASHAYLFYGPRHVGKYALALRLAAFLHCREFESNKKDIALQSCGSCPDCVAVAEEHSPYVTVLDRNHTLVSKKEKRTNIPIEDIRELKRMSSLTALSGKPRIVIINEVELMSEEAANAFLKLLEEPGNNTYFFMIAENKDTLFPTIVSRAQAIRFSLISDSLMKTLVATFVSEEKLKEEMVRFSEGRPGLLMKMIKEREFFESQKSAARMLHAALRGSTPNVFRLTEHCTRDDSFSEVVLAQCTALVHALIPKVPFVGTPKVSAFLAAMERMRRIREAIETTNANSRIAYDLFFLEARNMYGIISP